MANGSKPFLPGRGRRPIADAPGNFYGEKWYQQLNNLDKPKSKLKPKELRLVGGLYTISQHYIKFTKKGGGQGGYYEICLNFDPIKGEFRTGSAAICPICRDFSNQDLPKELQMFGTFRHYSDAFDIDKVKSGIQEGCFGVVWANKYGWDDWVKIGNTMKYPIDDLENGCTVFWYFDENAKDNKDKMSFTKGELLPVMYSEKLNKFGIKTPQGTFTGIPTAFDTIIQPKSAGEIERDLQRLGHYEKLEEVLKATRGGYYSDDGPPRERASTSRRSHVEEKPAQDETFDVEEPASERSFGKNAAHAAASDDDDWGAPSTPKQEEKTAAKGKSNGKKQAAPKQEPADDGWEDAAPTTTTTKEGKAKSKPADVEDFSDFGGGAEDGPSSEPSASSDDSAPVDPDDNW